MGHMASGKINAMGLLMEDSYRCGYTLGAPPVSTGWSLPQAFQHHSPIGSTCLTQTQNLDHRRGYPIASELLIQEKYHFCGCSPTTGQGSAARGRSVPSLGAAGGQKLWDPVRSAVSAEALTMGHPLKDQVDSRVGAKVNFSGRSGEIKDFRPLGYENQMKNGPHRDFCNQTADALHATAHMQFSRNMARHERSVL